MNTPTLADMKAWLGLESTDTLDDAVLKESLAASIASQCRVVCLPRDEYGDPYYSDDLREAVFLRTQRLAARRNSPEGIIGLSGSPGDFAAARVPTGDPDVLRLEGPYLQIPVA